MSSPACDVLEGAQAKRQVRLKELVLQRRHHTAIHLQDSLRFIKYIVNLIQIFITTHHFSVGTHAGHHRLMGRDEGPYERSYVSDESE